MAEKAGRLAIIKASGTATSFVGEATTGAGNLTYQITNAVKQVLDRTATIRVHKYSTTESAQAGTTTTNIKITAHGLVTNDLIVNTSRSDAARLITKVDNDNFTVSAVSGQTSADNIELYPTQASSTYSLNRLSGTVTYSAAVVRVIRVSGQYLPMATVAYAHDYSYARGVNVVEVPKFTETHLSRLGTTKFASGTLSQWDVEDTYLADALEAGTPIVLEFRAEAAANPERVWALLENDEFKSAAEGAQDEIVQFVSTDTLLTL